MKTEYIHQANDFHWDSKSKKLDIFFGIIL